MKRTLLLAVVLLLLPATGAAMIYSFIDEEGVLHMSNVPNDPRYRPMAGITERRHGPGYGMYDSEISAAARRYDLDPGLIKAVISAESNFNRHAVSPKGAMGLMQLMPDTARDMDLVAPFDPRENILAGSRYLRKMLNRFQGDLELALAAYNAGPERVTPEEGVPPITETRNYVKRVLGTYHSLRKQDSSPREIGSQETAPKGRRRRLVEAGP